MTAYHYQAINKSGKPKKGMIEADSERQARDILREKNLLPTEITAIKKSTPIHRKSKLSAQELSLFTRQLSTLLAAGLPVEESLSGVIEQTTQQKARQLLMGVRSKVVEGYSLARSMKEYPGAFPELYQSTVEAGEQSGRLHEVLEKLADYTEHQQKTKQKIQQALIYPALMVIVSVAIISFLLTFVVPKIVEVFNTSGQTLPTMTRVLISVSSLFENYGLYIGLFIILVCFLLYRALKHKPFKFKWDHFLLKLPLVAYIIRSTNLARYIHTFSILFSSGVSVITTMQVSSSLLTNLVMRKAFEQATLIVREGTSISQALKETGFLTPMSIHLIASGEKGGILAEMMERAANHLDFEVKRLIDTLLTLLEPIIILLMGAIVLFIVLATLLPIFSMEQLVI